MKNLFSSIKADPSWAAFLTFVFLSCLSLPLARIALVLCIIFTIFDKNRRRTFRISLPCTGWLLYLLLALLLSGALYASAKDFSLAPASWTILPDWLRESLSQAADDPLLQVKRGFRKLSKLLWYVAIPVTLMQVDSRSRLLKTLQALVLGAAVTALCVLFWNPVLAWFQITFPTDTQVQAGTATPLALFLHRLVDFFGEVKSVNAWIYKCGRATDFSTAFIKVGTMQAAQRLMIAVPAALALLIEACHQPSASRRKNAFLLLFLIVAGLILTCKRGPIMASAAVSFLLLLSRLRLWKAIAILLLIAGTCFAIPQVRDRFHELPAEFELHRGGRALMWKVIVPELHNQYPAGIGFRSLTYPKMSSIDMHVELNQNHVHSVPLQAFVEFGYLGIITWALWMFFAFYATGRLAALSRRPSDSCSLPETISYAVPLAMFFALFAYGLMEYNLADSDIVLLYALSMGLTNRNLLFSHAPETV